MSDEKLNMVLDIALTGLMPEGMRSAGQDDTYTLTVKLEEEPKSAYRISAEMAMQDFGKTEQRNVGYAAEFVILGTDTNQGVQFKAGPPNNEFIKFTGVRTSTGNGQTFRIGYKMYQKQLEFVVTTDANKKQGIV